MKILVESGVDVMQVKAIDGFTPLHIAASTNDAILIDFIFHHVRDRESAVNK